MDGLQNLMESGQLNDETAKGILVELKRMNDIAEERLALDRENLAVMKTNTQKLEEFNQMTMKMNKIFANIHNEQVQANKSVAEGLGRVSNSMTVIQKDGSTMLAGFSDMFKNFNDAQYENTVNRLQDEKESSYGNDSMDEIGGRY